MKKIILIITIVAVIVFLKFFYFWTGRNINQNIEGVNSLSNMTPEQILEVMTLEDKVGQMLMVGFWGIEPDYYISKMINQRNIGGVILMKYNFTDREQTKQLIGELQKNVFKNQSWNSHVYFCGSGGWRGV